MSSKDKKRKSKEDVKSSSASTLSGILKKRTSKSVSSPVPGDDTSSVRSSDSSSNVSTMNFSSNNSNGQQQSVNNCVDNRSPSINSSTSSTAQHKQCPHHPQLSGRCDCSVKYMVNDPSPGPEPRTVTLERDADLGFGFVAGSEKPVIIRFVKEGNQINIYPSLIHLDFHIWYVVHESIKKMNWFVSIFWSFHSSNYPLLNKITFFVSMNVSKGGEFMYL